MKFFVCIIALAAVACISSADKADKTEGIVGASYGAPPSYAPAAPSYAAPTYSAPPCPKNYLFSCQPNLAPVPCAAGGSSGGYAGAYSEHVPQYALPTPQYYYPQYAGVPQY